MSFVDLARNPSRRELRVFALLLPLFFGVAGGIWAWRTGSWRLPAALWVVGGGLGLAALGVSKLRWPLYALWMRAAFPVGWVISTLVLAVIFYGLLTPYGLVMRLMKRDQLQLKLNRRASTYWTPIERPRGKTRYFKQS